MSLYMHHARFQENADYSTEVKEALRIELEPPLNLHTFEVLGQYLAHIHAFYPEQAYLYD